MAATELTAWQSATGSSGAAADGLARDAGDIAWPPPRVQVGTCLLVLAGLLVGGAVLGWVWALSAPEVVATVISGGGLADPEFQIGRFFQGEAIFGALAVLGGLTTGLLTRWQVREVGPSVAVALTVGGLLASVVAWRLGVWLGPGAVDATALADGTLVAQPLRLRSPGLLFFWPLATMFVALWVSVLGPDDRAARRPAHSRGDAG